MRRPRVRLTVRGLMLVVAAIGLTLAIAIWSRRMLAIRAWRLQEAARHAAEARGYRGILTSVERDLVRERKDRAAAVERRKARRERFLADLRRRFKESDLDRILAGAPRTIRATPDPDEDRLYNDFEAGSLTMELVIRSKLDREERLERRWRHAADRPWLAVPPDPPPPKRSLY